MDGPIATSIRKVMLTKKWDVNDCKIKVSEKFAQNDKWHLTNATLNKHLLAGTWHVIFYNIFKRAITLFLTRNRLPAKKQENYNPAQKMVEKFGKSWVLLIHLSPLSHIID